MVELVILNIGFLIGKLGLLMPKAELVQPGPLNIIHWLFIMQLKPLKCGIHTKDYIHGEGLLYPSIGNNTNRRMQKYDCIFGYVVDSEFRDFLKKISVEIEKTKVL